MDLTNEFIRIKVAAGLLGVTPLTLRNWDKKGLLAAYRHPVNNYRLYRATDIQDLLTRIQHPIQGSAPAIPVSVQEPDIAALPKIGPMPPQVQKLTVMFEDEV